MRCVENQPQRRPEARILFHAVRVQRDHGDVPQTGLVKRPADEGNVVARPAAPARLRHDDGQPVCIVFSGENGLHDLAYDGDRGIARVIVDVFKPRVNGRAVVIVQNFDMVPMLFKNWLQNIKMDGAHLRRKDRIAVFLHLPAVFHAPVGNFLRFCLYGLFLPHPHRRHQAADTDTDCAKVVDLVDFQKRIELVAVFQNFIYLVGCYRVESAAEGVELNQLEIVAPGHKLRCRVQPGVIDPLVHDAQAAAGILSDRQAVLREYTQTIGRNQLGDAVVDLRVHVVGTSGQYNPATAAPLHL